MRICGRRAHPRSRGENHRLSAGIEDAGGSSPLTRGKPVAVDACVPGVGLIPAHAGKTATSCGRCPPITAHPRSRGENPLPSSTRFVVAGSSPLTRGKPRLGDCGHVPHGLIPAHAGKTWSFSVFLSVFGAHPRSRGENPLVQLCLIGDDGSSPLTRGKRSARPQRYRHRRLIPAHAGKTVRRVGPASSVQAHPRSRGENAEITWLVRHILGSSPLTRGKLVGDRLARTIDRLIPAHAGKTLNWPIHYVRRTAHPRSRGENVPFTACYVTALGSSPLTRGKPSPRIRFIVTRRLIPAHAGKTRSTALRV